ncbi:hypothetical protein E0E54_19815 [Azotobacter chroococcum]|uniref:hypothetical protein n=1 Tax=Azotobacter chroococcum TaxID=353 RepID=UPI0010389249|nr:hypothetical protein [Azotobacter chroococcum]TBW32189.1 hypothetical protein E0E54_19815 [Azotobacter chroococcum]
MADITLLFTEQKLGTIRTAGQAFHRLRGMTAESSDWRSAYAEWLALAEEVAVLLIVKAESLVDRPMTAVPFNRGGGEPPHIDARSFRLLCDAQIEARVLADEETDPQRRADLERLAGQLLALVERLMPSKGAA